MILKAIKYILLLPFKMIGLILAICLIVRYWGIKRAQLKMKAWNDELTEAIKANKSKSK